MNIDPAYPASRYLPWFVANRNLGRPRGRPAGELSQIINVARIIAMSTDMEQRYLHVLGPAPKICKIFGELVALTSEMVSLQYDRLSLA